MIERSSRKIVAIPKIGDAYTRSFYSSVERHGIKVVSGRFSARQLYRDLERGDWLHIHWPSFDYYRPERSRYRNWIALLRFAALLAMSKLRGAHLVWTAHNLYPHDGGRSPIHVAGRRIVCALADAVVVHGPTAAAAVRTEFGIPHERIVQELLAGWVGEFPNEVTRANARSVLNIPQDSYVYGSFGKIKPYKGVDTLLRTFARLEDASLRLLIAGKFRSAGYREKILRLVENDSRVVLVEGYAADEAQQVYFAASDIIVLPYRAILTSGNANLAMSFGCPLIAPRLGSLCDHVPEAAGILYDPSAIDGLEAAMLAARSRAFDRGAILTHASSMTWDALAIALRERMQQVGAK